MTWSEFGTSVILSLLSGSGVAYLFVHFSLESVIKRRHQKLLDEHKFQIDLEFDRISKINQKEFELVPEIWGHLIEFQRVMLMATDPEQYLMIDLNHMSIEKLSKLLARDGLAEELQELVVNAPDKNVAYTGAVSISRGELVRKEFHRADYVVKRNRIFITQELTSAVNECMRYYSEAMGLYDKSLNHQNKDMLRSFFESFRVKSKEHLDTISELMRDRLRFIEE